MNEQSNIRAEESSSGTSRRTALKLGLGAGVGLAAWSGPTITSLGGTPAYALACTFATSYDLTGCRNTAQANCSNDGSTIAYLPFDLDEINSVDGYFADDNMTNSIYCNGVTAPTVELTYPAGVSCEIAIYISETPDKCIEAGWVLPPITTGLQPAGDSPGYIELGLPTASETGPLKANTFYNVTINCVSTGDEACFADGPI
jgi:hypothetical protein